MQLLREFFRELILDLAALNTVAELDVILIPAQTNVRGNVIVDNLCARLMIDNVAHIGSLSIDPDKPRTLTPLTLPRAHVRVPLLAAQTHSVDTLIIVPHYRKSSHSDDFDNPLLSAPSRLLRIVIMSETFPFVIALHIPEKSEAHLILVICAPSLRSGM